jgi:hypothetical protein
MKRPSIFFECEGINHEGERRMHIMKKSKDKRVISKNICKACVKKKEKKVRKNIIPHVPTDIAEGIFYCTNQKYHIGERYLPIHCQAKKINKICKTCAKHQRDQCRENKKIWLQKQKDDGAFFECKDAKHEGKTRTSYNEYGRNDVCKSCYNRHSYKRKKLRQIKDMIQMNQKEGNQIDEEHIKDLSNRLCYFCNGTPKTLTFIVLDGAKTKYDPSNLKPSCAECSMSRKSMSIESYIQKCKDITFFQDLGVSPKTFIPHQQGRTTVCFAGSYAKYKGRDDGRKKKEFLLTKEVFKSIRKEACVYCGWNNKRYIGIDRIDSNQGYTVDNIAPACTTCNLMKNRFTKDSFLERCYRITHNQNRD